MTDQDTGTPRWVKVFGTAGAVLAVLIVVLMFTGHGPSRHGAAGSPAPAAAPGRHP